MNKDNHDKKTKVSISQLISEFNIINDDIKMISNYKNIKEREMKKLGKKFKNTKKINKVLANFEANKIDEKEKNKNVSQIKSKENETILKRLRCRSFNIKRPNTLASTNLKIKNEVSEENSFNRFSEGKQYTASSGESAAVSQHGIAQVRQARQGLSRFGTDSSE